MTTNEILATAGGLITGTATAVFTSFKTFATNKDLSAIAKDVKDGAKSIEAINLKMAGYDEVFQYLKDLRQKTL